MSENYSSFVSLLNFVPRKLGYSSTDSNMWTVILPPQTMKTLRILHDTAFVLVSQRNNKVFARVHNAVEYGREYSSLKPPNAVATEEFLQNLKVSPNVEVELRFEKVFDVLKASRLTLKYKQSFDPADNTWKCLNNNVKDKLNTKLNANNPALDSKNTSNVTSESNKPAVSEKKLDWCVSSDDSSPFPPVEWYNSLLNGEFNKVIRHSLVGCTLLIGNVVAINLQGYLCRFEVETIYYSNEICSNPLSVSLDTEVSVCLNTEASVIYGAATSAKAKSLLERRAIYGLDEIVETLTTHVFVPLLSNVGADPPTGVILYGPPGCGKTLLAKTIENYYKTMFNTSKELKFKMVHSTDLISEYPGKTELNVNRLLQDLKQSSNYKTICFIDEIDVLCLRRDSYSSDSHSRRILATFLNNMDGVNSNNKNCVIIGMTNCLDTIDDALRRPGRFDLEIEVPVPNQKNRFLILRSMLGKVKHNLNESQIKHVNDFCQAFVGADLKLLVTNAIHAKTSRLKKSGDPGQNGSSSQENEDALTFEDFSNALKVTRPSAMREMYVEVPHVKWSDIGGYEELKKTIKQSVEYPRKFSSLYESLNVQVPRGILLYGPPGCSKTLMAKAICTESHMNFISVKGPEIYDKYVGESERNIRRLFSKARVNSPCVIFFDEIDSVCSDDSSGVGRRVLGTLLNEMDGVSPLKQVLVVGATNRPQDLSKSLLRPGRFDRLIYVPLPDFAARKAIFLINFAKVKVDFHMEDVAHKLASLTHGYSGAEVVSICRQASMYLLNEIIEQYESIPNSTAQSSDLSDKDLSGDGLAADLERLSLSEVTPLSYRHLELALNNSKPMTSQETISFYENFSKANSL
ncbi:uncharacterized protein TOT_020000039 [Theileria orientalis strain Shintoku]|uniref:AAA+ ATPase domain-containing protein n=1 Tax=Theileria orientalis strain Shintoku TaxID=869250 RepID=J4C7W9_THEOR|nr:uncharacterized protein TOT_020000039 [Theileria orientalis strain Shintoku]BAM39768.1 uncharacterized protein TOT_020000039 [Theileria orientalis strain Shintoku]|eukprot:XP_009690069.1 uncharacterized protein TOT_020000039 [Theileria orientalis strain Shintoku]